MTRLAWPPELALAAGQAAAWFQQSGSNICLDLHGDPVVAGLCVFSDGNHHMALAEALQAFVLENPGVGDVFYATTPPRVIVEALHAGGFQLGNLRVPASPHVFISPPAVLEALVAEGRMGAHRPFAANCGIALLVRKGNPKRLGGIADLARDDVGIFLSNPVTEKVSYTAYAETLRAVAAREGMELGLLDPGIPEQRRVYGESIHHREAPQCVADGRADVAVIYHHLALRYVRVFPEVFDMLPLGLGAGHDPAHVVNPVHIGLVGDGGGWGSKLLEFMVSARVTAIYQHHGLRAV